MSRMYTVSFTNATVGTAAQDLWEINSGTSNTLKIRGIVFGNVNVALDAGDAKEQLLEIAIIRGYTTSGSGGTAGDERSLNANDSTATFSAEINNTTLASVGTPHTLHIQPWNSRAEFIWIPPAGMEVEMAANERVVVRLVSTMSEAIECSGTIYIEEFG